MQSAIRLRATPGTLLFWGASLIHLLLAASVPLFQLEGAIVGGLFVFSLVMFAWSLLKKLDNILYLARTFFLGIVGYMAMAVKLLNPSLIFGYHMRESQTLEIVTVMYVCTVFALFSSELAIAWVGRRKLPVVAARGAQLSKPFWQVLGAISFLAAMVGGQLIAQAMGPIVLVSSYGAERGESNLALNNLNSIVNISLYLLLLAYLRTKSRALGGALVICLGYVLIYCEFLRGVRMDVINALIGLFVVYQLANRREPVIRIKHLGILLAVFLVTQIMGIMRSVLSTGLFSLSDLREALFAVVTTDDASGIAFNQGTINDIAATFSGIILLLKTRAVDFLGGQSYLDFIPRTPPEFLWPDRPEDLSWIFKDVGYSSGGGFFELAEAYFNFGYLGCLIVPGLITWLLARAYRQAANTGGLWSYFVLFAFLSVLLRGLIYQSFAFWKAFVTAAILFGGFVLAAEIACRLVVSIRARRCPQ